VIHLSDGRIEHERRNPAPKAPQELHW